MIVLGRGKLLHRLSDYEASECYDAHQDCDPREGGRTPVIPPLKGHFKIDGNRCLAGHCTKNTSFMNSKQASARTGGTPQQHPAALDRRQEHPALRDNHVRLCFKLANDGVDTRSLQAYLGHRNIQNTTRYTALAPDRFKGFWKD